MRISHNSGTPLHLQVEKLIREMIEFPIYKNGELFPKEVDMAKKLGISRNTVRQAISKLVLEGSLERKKGVGTKVVVRNISTQLQSWMSFTQEMKHKGITVVNFNLDVTKEKANKEVSAALEIKEGTELIKLCRLRGDENGPFVYFVSYFHPRIGLTGDEDFKRPLYEILEGDYSIVVNLSRDEIKAMLSDEEISKLLETKVNSPILKRLRRVYDPGKRPVEYNICYYRADKFSYEIDINRDYGDKN
ncbi:GntR family transcriptional regulator [Flaviramulus basaltis]|uniref:GntR family transcriptional regulator n=1 Tax=Flaviramulus basaltis TaxID=369401 RepID=A0A1K2IMM6_9FLAO|nr:GntR family transcriptional regulator [Flaviramulus basaltis]SFZ93558.1 GntR family transcriptional regulator [Flaviramulus basaltis]